MARTRRQRDDAAGRAHGAHRVEHGAADVTSRSTGTRARQGVEVAASQPIRIHRDAVDGQPSVERLGQQVRAVEQHPLRVVVGGGLEPRDERVLSAGNGRRGHGVRSQLTGTRPRVTIPSELAHRAPHRLDKLRRLMKEQLLKKLHDEITALDRELKLELPLEIKRARELGDLRENAEYHAAKERQTYVQARISMLQKRVADIQLINLDKIPHNKAAFGSTVHLREDTGSDVVFQLVMPEDADVDKGLISTSSPIGRAIVGKEAGDEVLVVTPNGKRAFEITKLLTVHDLA